MRSGNGFLCLYTAIVIIVGLAARIVLGVLFTYPDDVQSWALTIANIEAGGGLYDLGGYNYAPIWGYLLAVIDLIGEPFGVSDFGARLVEVLVVENGDSVAVTIVPSVALAMMVKAGLFISDLAVSYLVWRIVDERTEGRRKADLAFALSFLCTFVITASSCQGMFDTVGTLFTLLAVMLIMKDRCFLGGMCFSAAVLLKVFPGFLVFILAAYILLKHRYDGTGARRVLEAVLGGGVLTAIVFVPQVFEGTLYESISFIVSRTSTMGGDYGALLSIATVVLYAVISIASIYLGHRMYMSQRGDLDGHMLSLVMLCIAVVFLFPANAQYLVLLAPFLVIQYVTEDERYRLPLILLMVGVPVFAMSSGAVNMMSLGGFTDLIGIDTVVSMVEWFDTELFWVVTPMTVLKAFWILEYAGIIATIVIRRRISVERNGALRQGISAN
ncbi:MAG: hypothetical protein Q4Q58_03840 [Thermoplasmata archaeon]|nr:hypothetical protein [Thermoplasmata archaeon]